MRIVIVAPVYPLRGGIAQFSARLAVALRAAGHDVVVHRFIRQYPGFLFPGKTQNDESAAPVNIDSIPSFDPLNPFNWPFAARRVAAEKPDLVIMQWWLPFFGLAYASLVRLAKLFGAGKTLYIVHNAAPHEKRPADLLLSRMALGSADGFVVMSEAVKTDLLRLVPDARYTLTPHPVYDQFGVALLRDEAKAALGLSGPVLLFFGLVREYKGLRVLLDALPAVIREMPVTLLVAGEFYEDRAKYDEQIKRLGLSDSVVVVDRFIPNEEVGGYFSAADLLVLPYLSATQSGITQIGYAFDLPVVATDVGGLPEVVKDGETGFLVPPEDPAALAAAILMYFREGHESEFKKNIAVEKRRFSWEGMARAIEGFVDNP